MPNQFFNVNNARSKLQANVGQKLYMEITYEILKENYAKTCKFYDLNAFDNCHIAEMEERILKKFNCTVPFLTNPKHKVCSSKKNYKEASKYFSSLQLRQFAKCASPCVNMLTTFGFPFFSNNNQSTGFVKLYFKNIVKITEDFVSYDLLRYYQKETFFKQQSYFSMVAEIGGYSGLLIGFSLMDIVSLYRNFLLFFQK